MQEMLPSVVLQAEHHQHHPFEFPAPHLQEDLM